MRGHMAISLFALAFGALEAGGALQELVYRGILNSETEPMIIGALGTAAGAMLLWAAIAVLIRSRLSEVLVPAVAYLSIPVFLISGVYKHYAGWPITLVGIVYPLLMWGWYWMDKKPKASPKR
jgi:hypothetical protein